MKKDKKWLKEQISYLQDGVGESFNDYSKGLNSAYNTLELLIDQLEEPEQEKVVVPQFVADFITEIKPNFNIRTVFTLKNNKHEQGQEWALDNPDVFARAWLDGYTVEKESQWVVKTGKNWFFKNFESVGEYNYQAIGTGSIEEAKKFKDKLEAESVALLSDGEVEEITK